MHRTATLGKILTTWLMWLIIREAVYKFTAITKLFASLKYQGKLDFIIKTLFSSAKNMALDSQELKVNKSNKL